MTRPDHQGSLIQRISSGNDSKLFLFSQLTFLPLNSNRCCSLTLSDHPHVAQLRKELEIARDSLDSYRFFLVDGPSGIGKGRHSCRLPFAIRTTQLPVIHLSLPQHSTVQPVPVYEPNPTLTLVSSSECECECVCQYSLILPWKVT